MGKIKVHGPRIEELRRNGKTYNEIAQEVGLTHEQVKQYFKRERKEARHRGYRRSKKSDAMKTNQALRVEIKSLRMEVALLRDFSEEVERK